MMPEKGKGEGSERLPERPSGEVNAERSESASRACDVPVSGRPAPRVRPRPKSELVSQQMSRMPRQNTKPELVLRRELHARGLRFRIHARLPGRPDLVFTRAKIAVF